MILKEIHLRKELFNNKPYVYFLISGIVATISNGLIYVTTSWYAFEYFKGISGIALLMILTWGPGIIFAPFFGVCADRYNRKFLLIVSNIMRGLAICAFVLLEYLKITNNIFILSLLLGIFVSFYMPAAIPFITSIVPKKLLAEANSTIDMIYEVGTVLGMGISGILIYFLGTEKVLFIGGLLFIIAGLLNAMMHYSHKIIHNKQNSIKEYFDSLLYLKERKKIILIYLVQASIMTFIMIVPILLLPYVRQVLDYSTWMFAVFEMLYSLGLFIGCFFAPILCKKYGFRITVGYLLMFLSINIVLLLLNINIIFNMITYFFIGFSLSTWALTIAESQAITDLKFQGRLQATFNAVAGTLILIFYLIITLYGESINIQYFYLLLAIFSIFSSVLIFKTPSL